MLISAIVAYAETNHCLPAHPRFNHPIFGEVEKCNWNAECVRKWDEDTAAFEKLTPEEKIRQVALKEADDKRKLEEEEKNKAEDEDRKAKGLPPLDPETRRPIGEAEAVAAKAAKDPKANPELRPRL